ncbi:MAG: hypothetical protein Q4E73_06165 [Lachnospiraceae bacterium]|nr:hypothetical protein [Lachnospiraceae bacterium]
MRREITIDHVRANLIKEYGTKPARLGAIAVFAGVITGVLCYGSGRLPATFISLIVVGIGIAEIIRSNKMKKRISSENLVIREGRCIEKRIKSSIGGTKRYFYFTKKSCYAASEQDIKLWEKTHIGDKFYLISFQDSKEIKKIYPQSILKYVDK